MANDIVNTANGLQIPNSAVQNINSTLTEASQALTNYVVSPLQQLGLGGFKFSKIINSDVVLSSQYSVNYVENGSYVTDHVIFEPKQLTVTGYVGEKVYDASGVTNILQSLTQKLTAINALVPTLTTGMQQIYDLQAAANRQEVQNTINTSVDFWNTLKALNPPKTATGQAYNYFVALWKASTIMSVQEPDGTYHTDMIIKRVNKKTRENTLDIVDFVVELQEWRTADTLYSTFNPANYAGRNQNAQNPPADQGKVQGTVPKNSIPQSILSSLFS